MGYVELNLTFSNLTVNDDYSNGSSNVLYQFGNNLTLSTNTFPRLETTVCNTGGNFYEGLKLKLAMTKYLCKSALGLICLKALIPALMSQITSQCKRAMIWASLWRARRCLANLEPTQVRRLILL
jgi:ABC-type branched-subunit amino acid transport system ATPase component